MKSLYESILDSTNTGKNAYEKRIKDYIAKTNNLSLKTSVREYPEITFYEYIKYANDLTFEFDLKYAYEFKYDCRYNGHVDFYFKDGALAVNFTKYNRTKKYNIFFVKGAQKNVMIQASSNFKDAYEHRISDEFPSSKRIETVSKEIRKMLILKYDKLTQ
jgi:uncharacterized protein YeeX (DUF496 family)